MTGHDDRRILSNPTDMMTTRTGSPDIMSVGSDLREQPRMADADMMTDFAQPMIVDHRDLRKHSVRRDLSKKRTSCPDPSPPSPPVAAGEAREQA